LRPLSNGLGATLFPYTQMLFIPANWSMEVIQSCMECQLWTGRPSLPSYKKLRKPCQVKIWHWSNTFKTVQPDGLVDRGAKGIFGKDACPFRVKIVNFSPQFTLSLRTRTQHCSGVGRRFDQGCKLHGTTFNGLNPSGHFFACCFPHKHKGSRNAACAGPPGFLRRKPVSGPETLSVLYECVARHRPRTRLSCGCAGSWFAVEPHLPDDHAQPWHG